MSTISYYDEIKDFTRLADCTEKVEIAISRLENPAGITEEKILMYQDYLYGNRLDVVMQFIDMNRLAIMPLLVKYRLIKKSNILKLTEYAREKRKMDMMSYLMDVGNQLRTRLKHMDIAPKFKSGKTPLPQQYNPDYSKAKSGDIIWLGTVPMPWQVLENKNGRLLLLSKYVLDCLPFEDFYDPFYFSMSFDRTRWPYSTIRRHISNDFYNSLLTEQEKQKVVPVYISADDSLTFENREGAKQDKMFLLSKPETEKYLKTEKDRLAPVTSFATRSMLYNDFETYAYWWLRTPGQYLVEKMYVLDGRITSSNSMVGGDHFNYLGVRPAMYFQVD
ncbi:MAG: hypothetical protein IKJ05_07735 [Oscillospiraceae bacterium]|nr:hypothetical protein [Oscillospiraceae bacterium]